MLQNADKYAWINVLSDEEVEELYKFVNEERNRRYEHEGTSPNATIVRLMAGMSIGDPVFVSSSAKRFDGHYRPRARARLGDPGAEWRIKKLPRGFIIERLR